jgi:hypothetical protein
LDWRSRLLIAWFGPRGLGSLLLILVPVFAGVPGTQPWFVICCLVVLLSVALHGGSLMFLARKSAPATSAGLNAAAVTGSVSNDGEAGAVSHDDDRITVQEFGRLRTAGTPVLVLDVRSDPSFASSEYQAQGALRIPPDQAARKVAELGVAPRTWVVVFCA